MSGRFNAFSRLFQLAVAAVIMVLVISWGKPSLLDPGGTSGSDEVTLTSGLSFMVETDSGLKTRLDGPTIREESRLRQSSYRYTILNRDREIGLVTLTCQDMLNGMVLFFVESKGVTTKSHLYQGRLILSGPHPTTGRALVYPEGNRVLGQSAWQTLSSDQLKSGLPPGITYLDGKANSLVFGPVDQFHDMGHGVYRETESFAILVRRSHGESEFRFPLSDTQGGIIRFWGIISNEKLVDWENETDVSSIQIADLNQIRKFWLDGVYDLVPFSYKPTHPHGFWRCPAQHVGRSFLTKTSPFTDAIAISSMYSAINCQNETGYWATRPQSNWLAEEYGFGHDFYDTRFNTDAALYLLEAYQNYKEDKALAAASRYADFLCGFARESAYRSKNGGYLIPDYQDSSGEHQTHSSLNHLLAEMNFLYEMHLTTGKEEYKKTANLILLAIKDTCNEWIKESGELWYARLPNGNYGFKDYPTLTLNDLRQSQKIITKISGHPDPDLARLIISKESYNRANGIPLW
ncbi:MAG: hypothetical protein ACM3UW_00285 [Bacillota bacterium]